MDTEENNSYSVEAIKLDQPSDREQDIVETVAGKNWKKYSRVAMAALSAIPWVGSLIGAGAALWSENEQGKTNEMLVL